MMRNISDACQITRSKHDDCPAVLSLFPTLYLTRCEVTGQKVTPGLPGNQDSLAEASQRNSVGMPVQLAAA